MSVDAKNCSLEAADWTECEYGCAATIKYGCLVVAASSAEDTELPEEISDASSSDVSTVDTKEVPVEWSELGLSIPIKDEVSVSTVCLRLITGPIGLAWCDELLGVPWRMLSSSLRSLLIYFLWRIRTVRVSYLFP